MAIQSSSAVRSGSGDRKPSAQPSHGDLPAEAGPSNYHDEIAAMAAALEQFRDVMNRGRAMNADPDSERAARAMWACPTESQIAELEAAVRDALGNLRHSTRSGQPAASKVLEASDTLRQESGLPRAGIDTVLTTICAA
jgi:hypothetical protein